MDEDQWIDYSEVVRLEKEKRILADHMQYQHKDWKIHWPKQNKDTHLPLNFNHQSIKKKAPKTFWPSKI